MSQRIKPLDIKVQIYEGYFLPFNAFFLSPNYYVENPNGQYTKLNEANLRLRLRQVGLDTKTFPKSLSGDKSLNALDLAMVEIQKQATIEGASALAGYPTGPYHMNGRNFLVTHSSPPEEAKQGPWPKLERFFNTLLEGDQKERLFYWLHAARKNLQNKNDWRPGQMLVLVGDRSCGKSFCQTKIITPLLGSGADPWQYITGQTQFNADLVAATHLNVGDPQLDNNGRSKAKFASALKQMTANEEQRLHGKGKDGFLASPKWRCSLSMNTEGTEFAGFPNLDPSVIDKLLILQCSLGDVSDDWEGFTQGVQEELPGFAYYLDHLEIPEEYQDHRFMTKHWIHPELETLFREHEPAERFWSFVQQELFHGGADKDKTEWTGSELELCTIIELSELRGLKRFWSESHIKEYLLSMKRGRLQGTGLVKGTGRGQKARRLWTIKKEI